MNIYLISIFSEIKLFEVEEIRTRLLEGMPEGIQSAILIVAIFLLCLIAYLIVRRSLLILAKREAVLSPPVVKRVYLPIGMALVLFGISQNLNLVLEWENQTYDHFAQVAWIFIVALLLIRTTQVGRMVLLAHYDLGVDNNLKARKVYTQIKVFERITNVTIVVLAIGLGLMTFENIRQIGLSILTSAGIAGIIIGLAAQKLIGNILAGLQIAITQPIRIDDVVIVEGEWGWIEEITLTYTVVRIWDKRRLVLPSTYFIENPFQNWTRKNSDILGTVFLYLDYRIPIGSVRNKLEELVRESKYWDGQVVNLQVTNMTEKIMELRVLVSAKNSPEAWELRVWLREQLITFIQNEFPEFLPKSRVELTEKKK